MKNLLTIQDVLDLLKKKIWLLLLFSLLGGIIATSITVFILPEKYSSEAQLVPKQPKVDALNANTINASLTLIDTYKDFVKGDFVLKKVKKQIKNETNYQLSLKEIQDSIEIVQTTNSQIFSIKVLTSDPNQSAVLANSIAQVFANNAENIVGGSKITIISKATPAPSPVSPNRIVNLLVGLILGFMAGIVSIYFSVFFGQTIKSTDFIHETTSFGVIGTISLIPKSEYRNGVDHSKQVFGSFNNLKATDDSTRNRRRSR